MNIKYETQTNLVAAEMEKRIRSGTFPPGSRLPSIRELADHFHVSTQVIKSAFKLLMDSGLLISKSRIGVFVNVEGILSGTKKLVLLNASNCPYALNYLGRVFNLSESVIFYEGFHVQLRTVPSGPLLLPALRYELHQIEMDHPDCLVINAGMVPPEEVSHFATRKFPVLFFGDFANGDIPGIQYDSIRERTEERGEAYIETAHRLGCKKVDIFCCSQKSLFVRKMLEEIKTRASLYGITIRTTDRFPDAYTAREILESWKYHLRKEFKYFTPDAFILDGFGHLELFLEALKELGFTPGKNIQVISDNDFIPGLVMIRSDYSEFAQSATAIIRRTIEEPGYHCGIVEIAGKIKRTPFIIDAVGSST